MVPIPAGKLMVYSKYDGKEVFIDNFFMDSFEVSQESYEKIINFNPSFFVHRKRPVEKVNWFTERMGVGRSFWKYIKILSGKGRSQAV